MTTRSTACGTDGTAGQDQGWRGFAQARARQRRRDSGTGARHLEPAPMLGLSRGPACPAANVAVTICPIKAGMHRRRSIAPAVTSSTSVRTMAS